MNNNDQERRKRKLAELKAKRAKSNLANAALAEKEDNSKRSSPAGKDRLPGPDEVYAASVFGAGGGGTGHEHTEKATPLVLGWRVGDVPDAPNGGDPPTRPHHPLTSEAGGGSSYPVQTRHQPQPMQSGGGVGGIGRGFPATAESRGGAFTGASPAQHQPPPPPFPQQFGHGPLPRGPFLPPPPMPPPQQQQQQQQQPMSHYLPGDPRGGHPPPPHHPPFVPFPPRGIAMVGHHQQQASFHEMAGHGLSSPGVGRGRGRGRGRGNPHHQQSARQDPPPIAHYGPGGNPAGQQPMSPAGNSGLDGRGRGGRRGGGGGEGRGRRGGHRFDGGREGTDGLYKDSFVEDPWKDLLVQGGEAGGGASAGAFGWSR